ncbi:MAG: penicillin-binding protein 2 [Bacteroidota bacterium]
MNDSVLGSLVRRRILFILITGVITIFFFQLFRMQILEQTVYEEKSDENSIKGIVDNPPRGIFYDRNFKFLISNKPAYTVEITPSLYNRKHDEVIEKMLGEDAGYISAIFKKNEKYSEHLPRKIKRDAPFSFIAWLEENQDSLNGVLYRVELQRDYPFGINGAHIFGYTKEIDAVQLKKDKGYYESGDYIGFNGIEKTYESVLRGKKGIVYQVVDSKQKLIGPYEEGRKNILPEKGNDLVLSIDGEIQKLAEQLFVGKIGALVALEPKSGDILALVSSPNYDLSDFSSVTSTDLWNVLSQREDKPLFNRATMGFHSPGSTFKMMIALAALEKGVINENTTITCNGGYQFGNRFFKCTHIHGRVNVVKAIEKSCNSFFYPLVPKIGIENLYKYGSEFGFGHKTGIDIGEEASGILPNLAYYNRVYGKGKWTEGFFISLGIGQGELIASPLQLANYTAMIATGGTIKKPHIVKGYFNEKGEYVEIEFPEIRSSISKKNMDLVREGMYKVVNGEGTATWIRDKDIAIAGKTGTVQNPHGEDHALFIAFAPYEDPKIAIAVIVENVGFGSTHAAPIVKEIIKKYLTSNTPQDFAITEESKAADENKL